MLGVEKNQTTAMALFQAALELESSPDYSEEDLLRETAEEAAEPLATVKALASQQAQKILTPAETQAALQELSRLRHQHSRRWHAAGFAARTTEGVAPTLAIAVLRVDALLQKAGFNTTVRELTHQTKAWFELYAPAFVNSWLFGTPVELKSGQNKLEKFRAKNTMWQRVNRCLREAYIWVTLLEERDYELYSALRETLLLIVIVIISKYMFDTFRR